MPRDDLFKGLDGEQREAAEEAAKTADASSGAATKAAPKRSSSSSSKRSSGRTKQPPTDDTGDTSTPSLPRREKLTPKWETLRKRVASLYVSVGMVLMMADDVTGSIFIQNADDRSFEWIEVAQQDSRVEDILTKLTAGGAYGSLLMGHTTMLLAILARFGLLGPANHQISALTGVPVHPNFVPNQNGSQN